VSSLRIWFWQRIVTPHMTELATQLSLQGCDVTYVAEQPMSADRVEQGWLVPDLKGVRLEFAPDVDAISTLVASAPDRSIHICQGIRGNGLVAQAQAALKARGLRQWVVMETVDDTGWQGAIKRLEYRRLFRIWRKHLRGLLATGHSTPEWAAARGMPHDQTFPFAYFLGDLDSGRSPPQPTRARFRFIFVGQFIERKRFDLLLEALHSIQTRHFELTVIGSGPLESSLRGRAKELLPGRVNWVGRLPLDRVPAEMGNSDCLVLPSRHDGWGAVVSEAMMVGTPVICSDTCGAAGVVRASGRGGVFRSRDRGDLIEHLQRVLSMGLVTANDRVALANWASCLGAQAGASYLIDILEYDDELGEKPLPPWSEVLDMPAARSSSLKLG
jgi:glycosyltransferase involved in cell wall biosynthesis